MERRQGLTPLAITNVETAAKTMNANRNHQAISASRTTRVSSSEGKFTLCRSS